MMQQEQQQQHHGGDGDGPPPPQQQPRLVAGREIPLLEMKYELTTTTTAPRSDDDDDNDHDDIVVDSIKTLVLRRHETTTVKFRITNYATTVQQQQEEEEVNNNSSKTVVEVYLQIHAIAFRNEEYEMYKRNDLGVVDRLIHDIIDKFEEVVQQQQQAQGTSIICRWIYEPRQIVLPESNNDCSLEYRMTVQFHLDRMPLEEFRSLFSSNDFNVTSYWKPLPKLPQNYIMFQHYAMMNLNMNNNPFGFGGRMGRMMMMGNMNDGPPRQPMRGGGGPPPPFGGSDGDDAPQPPVPAAAAAPPQQQLYIDDNMIRTQCEIQATEFLKYIADEALYFAGWVTKSGGTSGGNALSNNDNTTNTTTRVIEIVGTSQRETLKEKMEAAKRKEEREKRGGSEQEEEEEVDEDGGTPIPVVFPPGVPSQMPELPSNLPRPSVEEAKQTIKDAVYDATSNYDWITIMNFE